MNKYVCVVMEVVDFAGCKQLLDHEASGPMLVAVVVVVVVVGKGSIVRTAGAFVTHLMPDLCQCGVHWLRSPIECHVSEVDLKPLTPPLSPPPHPIPS